MIRRIRSAFGSPGAVSNVSLTSYVCHVQLKSAKFLLLHKRFQPIKSPGESMSDNTSAAQSVGRLSSNPRFFTSRRFDSSLFHTFFCLFLGLMCIGRTSIFQSFQFLHGAVPVVFRGCSECGRNLHGTCAATKWNIPGTQTELPRTFFIMEYAVVSQAGCIICLL